LYAVLRHRCRVELHDCRLSLYYGTIRLVDAVSVMVMNLMNLWHRDVFYLLATCHSAEERENKEGDKHAGKG
jgi:hypothetical protein